MRPETASTRTLSPAPPLPPPPPPPPGTATGLVCCSLLPMPSCPKSLRPQHLTPPPASIAHVCKAPRAMAVVEKPAAIGGAVRGGIPRAEYGAADGPPRLLHGPRAWVSRPPRHADGLTRIRDRWASGGSQRLIYVQCNKPHMYIERKKDR